jgi:hypothetical protein
MFSKENALKEIVRALVIELGESEDYNDCPVYVFGSGELIENPPFNLSFLESAAGLYLIIIFDTRNVNFSLTYLSYDEMYERLKTIYNNSNDDEVVWASIAENSENMNKPLSRLRLIIHASRADMPLFPHYLKTLLNL